MNWKIVSTDECYENLVYAIANDVAETWIKHGVEIKRLEVKQKLFRLTEDDYLSLLFHRRMQNAEGKFFDKWVFRDVTGYDRKRMEENLQERVKEKLEKKRRRYGF